MKNHLIPLLFLALAAITLSLPILKYGYLMEDYYYLRSYSPEEIVRTFHSHWEPSMIETKGFRPLHSVHYALFHSLIGGGPLPNQLLALALHLAGVFLLYAFVTRCGAGRSAAFWSALVYFCLGTTAWQVSWLVNRQHLLLVIFLFSSLISYDRYLAGKSGRAWSASFVFLLLALLLKEAAVTFPFMIAAFTFIVRKRSLRSQVKPLLPLFLLLAAFLSYRAAVLSPLPDVFCHPPPPPDTPERILSDYGHGLFAALLQSHGTRDPSNRDFPVYARGIRDTRCLLAFLALLGLAVTAVPVLFRHGPPANRRLFLFAVILLLLANVMVAAWYRNNRLFISSLGVAVMVGVLAATAFSGLTAARGMRRLLPGAALVFFLLYLSTNLHTYLEIQWGLRPDGYLARTWDGWLVDEGYLPWMREEQLLILEEKLQRTGKLGPGESISRFQGKRALPGVPAN